MREKKEHRPTLQQVFPGSRPPRTRPYNMERMEGLTIEQKAVLEKICQDIFIDMDNARWSLTETLVACYLSGVHHALSIMKEKTDG